jgi:murein hydrolase activator
LAQAPPEDARKRLDQSRRALTEQDKRAGELQSELARLKEDEGQIRSQQVQTARIIQASEAQLSAIEQRSKELEAQADLVRGSLELKKGSLAGLLAAMQRMGRNPPPVMITRRQDALEMVRSAKLIAASAPELAAQANALADQLSDFVRLTEQIKQEGDKLRAELRQLGEAQTRLAALNDMRRQTLADRNREFADVRRVTTDIKREVADLNELITRTDKELAERTRLGQYEKDLAAQAARAAPAPAATTSDPAQPVQSQASPAQPVQPPGVAPKAVATLDIRPPPPLADTPARPATTTKAAPPPVTLAPTDRMAMASPGRLQPAMPFADAKGRLPLPVSGRRVVGYGEKTQRGAPFQGIAIQTRHSAQVIAPTDGWVVYAGEFRSYGQILIINAGGGYHILLANLSQIDAQQGQFVLAGEPVGTMAPAPKGLAATPVRGGTEQADAGAPILYIEFKKDNRSIDPGPWWAEPGRKNAHLITPEVILPQFVPG